MKVNSVADLPEWFSLEKYRGCAEFGPVEWWACLKERKGVVNIVPYLPLGEPAHTREVLARMRAAPLQAARRTVDIINTLASRPAVRSATWEAMARTARLDRLRDNEQAVKWDALGRAFTQNEDGEQPTGDIMVPAWLDEGTAAVAIVDLSATDKTLKAAFSAWLEKAREITPPTAATRNRPAVDRWAEYGLLPYIDLQIWCEETDSHIPEHVMRDAIHPHCAKGCPRCESVDWIGDTLAILARNLMIDLSPLRAYAAENISDWARAMRARMMS
ncbi:DUF6387 family protein [Pseudomonas sp. NPDC077408]